MVYIYTHSIQQLELLKSHMLITKDKPSCFLNWVYTWLKKLKSQNPKGAEIFYLGLQIHSENYS